MKTSNKRREQEIGTQRKTVTFGDPDRKWGKLNKTWSKEVYPGRRTLKKVGELMIKTRKKKICPGSRVLKKMVVMRNKRIKFCPGSLDGLAEHTSRNLLRGRLTR